METTALKDLLATRLGVDADSLGPYFLPSVARWALQHSGHRDIQRLVDEAARGGEAWQRLMENVVVAETWFFRDTAPFEHITDVVRAKWAGPDTTPVRVLSCPCSTGEEPYSIAIALTAAGFPPEAFTIDAGDVSPKAIHAARAGAFPARSFRPSDAVDRGQYFDYDHGNRLWQIKPDFRTMIRFEVLNVVSHAFASAGRYDIVLCRNLLIYLHARARASVLVGIQGLLNDGGVLIVGHAESGIAREFGFKGTGNPKAFAFTHSSGAQAKRTSVMGARREPVPRKAAPASASFPSLPKIIERSRRVEPTLEHIRQLGDLGRMEEAICACREFVKRVPDSAEGHFLLGVLCGALGQERAAEAALRRVLYLEPKHIAALQQLALTHDARGDRDGAARLRARAERSLGRRSAQ